MPGQQNPPPDPPSRPPAQPLRGSGEGTEPDITTPDAGHTDLGRVSQAETQIPFRSGGLGCWGVSMATLVALTVAMAIMPGSRPSSSAASRLSRDTIQRQGRPVPPVLTQSGPGPSMLASGLAGGGAWCRCACRPGATR